MNELPINIKTKAKLSAVLILFISLSVSLIGCKDTAECRCYSLEKFESNITTVKFSNALSNQLHWEYFRSLTFTGFSKIKSLLLSVFNGFSQTLIALIRTSYMVDGLYFEKVSSGVEYPNRDEAVDIVFGKDVYHIRIYHAESIGPHFSSPLFGVTRENEWWWSSTISSPNLIAVLQWHSIKGYFFSLKSKDFAGFFIEDGVDNWNWGASGLIFINEGLNSTAWYWKYDRDPDKKRGSYQIKSTDINAKPFPASFLKILSPLLAQAEKEAEYWPGP